MGRVANPHDLLMWFKTKEKKQGAQHAANGELALLPPALDSIALDEYVSEHLIAALDILPAHDMTAALHQVPCTANGLCTPHHDVSHMLSTCAYERQKTPQFF